MGNKTLLYWLLSAACGLITALLLFWGIYGVSQDSHAAEGARALALALIPQLRREIQRRRVFGLDKIAFAKSYTLNQHLISNYWMGFSVIFFSISLSLVLSVLGGLIAGLGNFHDSSVLAITGLAGIIPFVISCVLIGKWVGKRCRANGIATILASVIIGMAIVHGGDFLFYSKDPEIAKIFSSMPVFGINISRNFQILFTQIVTGSLTYSVLMLIGYFFGRRSLESGYVARLFALLPAEARAPIVDLISEEVTRGKIANVAKRTLNISPSRQHREGAGELAS